MDGWDAVTVFCGEVDLIVKGDYRTLRMDTRERGTTGEMTEDTPSTTS